MRYHFPMADAAIADRVRGFLAFYSGAQEATLRSDSTPQNTEGWDSLANLNLMAALESEYGFTIATRDVLKLRSLGDIVEYVQANMAVKDQTG
jgi:acyl carrier protein